MSTPLSKNKALYGKLMKEARRLIKEIASDNRNPYFELDIPYGTAITVEREICGALYKMGWDNVQVIFTQDAHILTFCRKYCRK